jgi:hypothetical protein
MVSALAFAACKDEDTEADDARNDSSAAHEAARSQLVKAARSASSTSSFAPVDWVQVAHALGKSGSMEPGDVYKVGLPRTDLKVSVGGVAIRPALALGSWVAFKQTGTDDAMVMGDLVLTEDEVTPVLTTLAEGGISLTALHNHLQHETPHVMYLHIMGQGEPVKLAAAIHAAVALSQTPLGTAPAAPAAPASFGFDTAQVAQALGASGKANGGIYQVSIPRAEVVTDGGVEVAPAMGTATAINFQPTGGGKAAITGDFVLTANEVNPVIRALRQNGVEVTALHSHMLDESPRLFFMHFWANDDAVRLAKALRGALDTMNTRKP